MKSRPEPSGASDIQMGRSTGRAGNAFSNATRGNAPSPASGRSSAKLQTSRSGNRCRLFDMAGRLAKSSRSAKRFMVEKLTTIASSRGKTDGELNGGILGMNFALSRADDELGFNPGLAAKPLG